MQGSTSFWSNPSPGGKGREMFHFGTLLQRGKKCREMFHFVKIHKRGEGTRNAILSSSFFFFFLLFFFFSFLLLHFLFNILASAETLKGSLFKLMTVIIMIVVYDTPDL